VTHTYIQAIKQPTLHYLTRSVRRRAATSKRRYRRSRSKTRCPVTRLSRTWTANSKKSTKRSTQSNANLYPGVPLSRAPKAWASRAAMSRAIHATGVSRIVTSSKGSNTGPTSRSEIAAALRYRRCMRDLFPRLASCGQFRFSGRCYAAFGAGLRNATVWLTAFFKPHSISVKRLAP
jgi:hypothetical protein